MHDIAGYDRAALDAQWDEHQHGVANHSWALWRWISLTEWLSLLEQDCWKKGMPHV
ncbi:MAG: hypothetical protein ACKVOE_03310 [Rickettsiales bacterium]